MKKPSPEEFNHRRKPADLRERRRVILYLKERKSYNVFLNLLKFSYFLYGQKSLQVKSNLLDITKELLKLFISHQGNT